MFDTAYQNVEAVGITEVTNCSIQADMITMKAVLASSGSTEIQVANYSNGALGISVGRKDQARAIDFDQNTELKKSNFLSVEETERGIRVQTETLQICITKTPYRMNISNRSGMILIEEEPADIDPLGKRQMPPFGFSLDESGRTISTNLCFTLPYDEHFFGFGESFTSLDKRGLSVEIWNKDALGVRNDEAYKNVPFFISSRGYGFYLNHAAFSRFQMGSSSTASWQVQAMGQGTEYFVIPGESAADIITTFTAMSGRSPLPPIWSFGLWVSNGFYNADRNSMLQTAAKLRKLKIPADVLHFDCYWLNDNRWCDLEWNTDRFPEPRQMLEHLSGDGFHSSLWINPYVSVQSPMFEEGRAKGFFLKDSSGKVLIRDVWHSLQPECAIIDFTNEEEIAWFKEKLTRLLDMGVDVFKTDFGEDIPVEACYADGSKGGQMHNLYTLYYNRTVFELTASLKGYGLVWGRSGFTGSQKYPVCWSGDPATSYPAMAAVLRGGLSLGLSGIPFWSHDIGGFYGDQPNPELYVRWAQFGLFSSHSRCHGTTSREPWDFGERARTIFTQYAQLRYSLLPYVVSQAKMCTETGLPFIKPLWIESFSDPTCLMIEDQYLFGSDILVAPVLEQISRKDLDDQNGRREDDDRDGRGDRRLYLPKGSWYDFHTQIRYEGEQWITIPAPLEIFPLFVRSGAVIPRLKRDVAHTGEINWEKDLYLQRYGEDASKTLHWFSPTENRWIELHSGNTAYIASVII